jgi:ribonuclease HI
MPIAIPKIEKDDIVFFADGGSRGNPGPAASGVVITKYIYTQPTFINDLSENNLDIISSHHRYLGHTTNNQAEYDALLLALEQIKAIDLPSNQSKVFALMDSLLVVSQITGQWKVKDALIREKFNILQDFIKKLSWTDRLFFAHIPRNRNSLADTQVNICLDNR